MESTEQLHQELKTIQKWEKEQKKVFIWDRIARLPFTLLDKITPKKIQEKLNVLVGELSKFVENGGKYLVNKEKYLENHGLPSLAHIEEDHSIAEMNDLAERIGDKRARFAKYQGATTGIGGIFTLAVDVPLLLGLSLKVLQEMALAYGYDPHDQKERVFIVKCLQFAYADVVGKRAVLEDIEAITGSEQQKKRVMSQLQGWREVFTTYSEHVGWKKLFQLVPIVGIIFGAVINKNMINDIAETGQMLFKKRRILERLKARETNPIN